MKSFKALLAAVAAIALAAPVAAPVAFAQALNSQEADIRAFIQDVARQTGRTFIIDPRVNGRVTVFSTDTLSEAELFEVFLSTLRANGLVAIPTASGAYRITPEEGVAQQPGAVGQRGEGFVTEIFRLRHLDATAAAETVRPLVGRQGQVLANRGSNMLVVADYADNVRRIRGLVGELDQDRSSSRTITLRNSSVSEMAQVVDRLAGGRGEGAARLVVAVPIPSSNSLILRGDPEAIATIAPMIEDLDIRAQSQSDVRVVFLRHANADQVLAVIQEVLGQNSTPAGEGQATLPRRAAVARFAGANALVISADPETQRTLADVILQLDQRRGQVLVEAIVVEISDDAARELGVQMLFSGTEGSSTPFAATNYSDSAPNILAAAGAVLTRETGDDDVTGGLRRQAIGQLLGVNGAIFGTGGELNDNTLFGVIINAVRKDDASNILSTPSVMTLDNEEATILVGQEVPITTSETLREGTSNPFRTVQRQNVGVQLDVRPQINEGGQITLHLRQEVSSIFGPVSGNFDDLILNKREISTTVIVDDGEIVALGGLIDDSERRSESRVPILGDIPVVGNLFRSSGSSRERTNLMIFIRPRIVSGSDEARAITEERVGAFQGSAISAAQRSALQDIADRFMAEQRAIDGGGGGLQSPETSSTP